MTLIGRSSNNWMHIYRAICAKRFQQFVVAFIIRMYSFKIIRLTVCYITFVVNTSVDHRILYDNPLPSTYLYNGRVRTSA